MPLIMFVYSSFNTYVNLPKKRKKEEEWELLCKKQILLGKKQRSMRAIMQEKNIVENVFYTNNHMQSSFFVY
jgi:hypothetical protein